jgi:DNA primase
MELEQFQYGLVKGMNMIDVLNAENLLEQGYPGINYLFIQFERVDNQKIIDEIENCLMTVSPYYIIRFGKHQGKTLEEIYTKDSHYVRNVLNKSKNTFIKRITEYFLQGASVTLETTEIYEVLEHKRVFKLNQIVNQFNAADMRLVLNLLGPIRRRNKVDGKIISTGTFEGCPFCEKKSPAGEWWVRFYKAYNGNHIIVCHHCKKKREFISFLAEQRGVSRKTILYEIARLFEIDIKNIDISDVEIEEKRESNNAEIVLEKLNLEEINIDEFGFEDDVMHPVFFEEFGLTWSDMNKYDVKYGGKKCNDITLKERVCFPVKDLDNRVVGVVGVGSRLEKDEQDIYKREYMVNKGFMKSHVLYNLNVANNIDECKELYICQQPHQMIRLKNKLDRDNRAFVAMMGQVLSKGQLYLLYKRFSDESQRLKVYLCIGDVDEKEPSETNARYLNQLGFYDVDIMAVLDIEKVEIFDEAFDLVVDIEPCKQIDDKKKIVLHDLDSDEYIEIEGLE